MSGSTRVEGGGQWWRGFLETPRVSFAPPEPGADSGERAYHDKHKRSFERAFARAAPFDEWVESQAERYGLVSADTEGAVAVVVRDWRLQLELFARSPLAEEAEAELSERARRVWERLQWPPAGSDRDSFSLVRWRDGAVEDCDGVGPGGSVPEDLPPEAAAELVRRCAEIVAAAEREGAVHPDLHPDQMLLDLDGAVSLRGYGEEARDPRIPGAPQGFYEESGPAPDWIGVQRQGLGTIAAHWGVAADPAPDPAALAASIPASDALDAWVRERWGPPFVVGRPRGRWTLDARLARGGRGVLRPCGSCGAPTMVGSCMSRTEEGRTVPTCRRCVDSGPPASKGSARPLLIALGAGLLLFGLVLIGALVAALAVVGASAWVIVAG